MKRLISSQRFGMIAEICDVYAMEIAESARNRGLKPSEVIMFALKKRLDIESTLNGADDDTILKAYEQIVCDR